MDGAAGHRRDRDICAAHGDRDAAELLPGIGGNRDAERRAFADFRPRSIACAVRQMLRQSILRNVVGGIQRGGRSVLNGMRSARRSSIRLSMPTSRHYPGGRTFRMTRNNWPGRCSWPRSASAAFRHLRERKSPKAHSPCPRAFWKHQAAQAG